jgi:hypothetical protein
MAKCAGDGEAKCDADALEGQLYCVDHQLKVKGSANVGGGGGGDMEGWQQHPNRYNYDNHHHEPDENNPFHGNTPFKRGRNF